MFSCCRDEKEIIQFSRRDMINGEHIFFSEENFSSYPAAYFPFDFSSIFIFRCAHTMKQNLVFKSHEKLFLSNFSFYAVCIVVCIHILRIYNDRIFFSCFGWRNGTHFNKATVDTSNFFLVIHLFINLEVFI